MYPVIFQSDFSQNVIIKISGSVNDAGAASASTNGSAALLYFADRLT
jgi:hypothetical protein